MGDNDKLAELKEKLEELNKRHQRACGSHRHSDSVALMQQIEDIEDEIAELEKD